jgi:hypothetical protein
MWVDIFLRLEPMGKPVTKEYYTNIGSVTRLIRGTIYKLHPSRTNGRPRMIFITEDLTEMKKLEEEIDRKRKKIEKMDESIDILMKFFDYSPMIMGSLYIQDDELIVKLVNPSTEKWLLHRNPNASHILEKMPINASKCFPSTCEFWDLSSNRGVGSST